ATFCGIATRNRPLERGTFDQHESRLARFLTRVSLGYPAAAAEKAWLLGGTGRSRLDSATPVLSRAQLLALQAAVPQVTASEAIVDYLLRLATRTPESHLCAWGLSPRASLGALAAARAWALLGDRAYVL